MLSIAGNQLFDIQKQPFSFVVIVFCSVAGRLVAVRILPPLKQCTFYNLNATRRGVKVCQTTCTKYMNVWTLQPVVCMQQR